MEILANVVGYNLVVFSVFLEIRFKRSQYSFTPSTTFLFKAAIGRSPLKVPCPNKVHGFFLCFYKQTIERELLKECSFNKAPLHANRCTSDQTIHSIFYLYLDGILPQKAFGLTYIFRRSYWSEIRGTAYLQKSSAIHWFKNGKWYYR